MTTTTPAGAPDPWYVPPAPPTPLPDLVARYSPTHGVATIAVLPHDVVLGDVVDHTDGLMVVTEITRRSTTWTLGGYNPALPKPRWPLGDPAPDAPPMLRHLRAQPRIRARRPATAWSRLPGHTKHVTAHNPVKRGMYTLNEGWDAACSCGWTDTAPHHGRGLADDAMTAHRAQVLTDFTHHDLPGLDAIERLEQQLGDVLPWRFDHGAQAQLRGLTTAQALTRLGPWADTLGVTIEHMSGGPWGSDEHFLWVDSRAAGTGPGLDIRAYPDDPEAQP